MTPAAAISTPNPSLSESAKNAALASAGVTELTVVVKYVISTTGDVTSAVIARGNSSMDAQILATVRSWKFKPALTEDGKPVSVSKVAKFRFKLKT
ncbi:MAG: energy transducer TonB [Polyangiaceae bacterium]